MWTLPLQIVLISVTVTKHDYKIYGSCKLQIWKLPSTRWVMWIGVFNVISSRSNFKNLYSSEVSVNACYLFNFLLQFHPDIPSKFLYSQVAKLLKIFWEACASPKKTRANFTIIWAILAPWNVHWYIHTLGKTLSEKSCIRLVVYGTRL